MEVKLYEGDKMPDNVKTWLPTIESCFDEAIERLSNWINTRGEGYTFYLPHGMFLEFGKSEYKGYPVVRSEMVPEGTFHFTAVKFNA